MLTYSIFCVFLWKHVTYINMEELTFWTGNSHKLDEVRCITWVEFKWYSAEESAKIEAELHEIQSMNIVEIVMKKAEDAYRIVWRPIIVEDTWLFIEALNWFPWPLVKYVVDWPWLEAIFKMMQWFENRFARAITWVCMFDWIKHVLWYWVLEWIITETPRWDKFWYSNAFEPKWTWKTFWEMTEDEKNQISMRKIAFLDFMEKLREYNKN